MKNNSQELPGTVTKALPNLKGFDTDTIVTLDKAKSFKKNGYSFCIRYLSRGNKQQQGDLSFNEAVDILDAGLALSAVQHVPEQGWKPTAELGQEYGKNAASNANAIGLPKGMNIWCDLEGVSTSETSQNVIEYCNAWYDAVHKAGYVPGIYVGYNCKLSGQELYYDLRFKHYWKSMSSVPPIQNRGYQLIQSLNTVVNGINIDLDTTKDDNYGNAVLWLKI